MVLTVVLNVFEQQLALSSILRSCLALVVAATAVGGGGPAVLTTLGAFGPADFFVTAPYHTFVIDEPSVVVALVVFTSVAAVVSWLVDHAARRLSSGQKVAISGRVISSVTRPPSPGMGPDTQLQRAVVGGLHEIDPRARRAGARAALAADRRRPA